MTTSDSLSNDGGSAFPCEQGHCPDGTWNQTFDPGMSLRDYFAAQALPLIGSAPVPDWQLKVWFGNRGGLTREEIAARAAYEYADAMLKAREVKNV
jgi:hypothetical protein